MMLRMALCTILVMGTQVPSTGLTVKLAERLVRIVAEQEGYDLADKHYYIDKLRDPQGGGEPIPGYFSFGLYLSTPKSGAEESLRYYAVDSSSGDVIEANLCVRYRSISLDREKQSSGLDRLRKKSPSEIEAEIGCANLREKELHPKSDAERSK